MYCIRRKIDWSCPTLPVLTGVHSNHNSALTLLMCADSSTNSILFWEGGRSGGIRGRGLTNDRPGHWSCDLRTNERPQHKLHMGGTTHTQHTKWRSVKINIINQKFNLADYFSLNQGFFHHVNLETNTGKLWMFAVWSDEFAKCTINMWCAGSVQCSICSMKCTCSDLPRGGNSFPGAGDWNQSHH